MDFKNTIARSLSIGFVSCVLAAGPALAAGGGDAKTDPNAMAGKHFHEKGKLPSKYTVELQDGLRKSLPFEDKRDFEEAKKGLYSST